LNHGNPYAPPPQNAYYGQPRRPDDNVSASVPVASGIEHSFASARGGSGTQAKSSSTNDRVDGIIQPDSPEPRSEKTVQFDLIPRGPSREPSPEKQERGDESEDESDHRRHRRRRTDDERSDSTRESGRRRKRHHRDESPASDSDATIDLPPRFDEHGRRRPEDPVADKLESVLQSLFR
jgi:hypothetical protein